MENTLKLEILKSTDYGLDYEVEIKELEGLTLVKSFYSNQFFNIDDIELIDYNGNYNLPISKSELRDNFRKCANCGEWLQLGEDIIYEASDSGNIFCEDCSCDLYYCDRCGDYHEYEDSVNRVNSRGGSQYWCESCIESFAFWCDRCEEYHDESYYNCATVYDSNDNRETWCEGCLDYAYYCDHCDRYVDEDTYDYDEEMCYRCLNDTSRATINRYHHSKDNNTLTFYGESKYTHWAGIGFELEVDTTFSNAQENQQKLLNALKERFGDRITFERDSSLNNGFEIISAPHTKDEMELVNWGELMQLCKDHKYVSHDAGTCGLHFHVSGYMFGANKAKQHDTIAKVVAFYNHFYNDFVKLSRRRDGDLHWAEKYGIEYNGNIEDYKASCLALVGRASTGWGVDRYRAINLTNYEYDTKLFKTVEFRINRGTLNINTFNATYDLIITMIKNAKKIDWTSADFFNPKKWFSGCKANTYAYIVKRNAFDGVFYLPQANSEIEYTEESANA